MTTDKTDIQLERERKVFGMTADELDESIANGLRFYRSRAFLAVSMLSDVQEHMALSTDYNDDLERARQLVNCIKYILTPYIEQEIPA